jgi:hypothetical protein
MHGGAGVTTAKAVRVVAPTPTLPRKREREQIASRAREDENADE